ncbi:DUF1552 domain-containing protein [Gemmata sp.]|uniref:DUF1552 domain-containing protein n=1 Tax=Gemmata sp. TaxID=1914242 RepID=UPI003F72FAA4
MTTRRDFMATAALGATGLALAPRSAWARPAGGKPPMRFIFLHKGNGLFPSVMVPPSLGKDDAAAEAKKGALNLDLARHELPAWMKPVAAHQGDLTILQGLSGKMCTTGHHTWCSALGAFKANERVSSIKCATVDFELAKLFPSPMEHVEFACFPLGGGNARGTLNGIATGFSARGPQQPNYAFGSPKVAAQELFKSVSTDEGVRARARLGRSGLEFAARREGKLAETAPGGERAKVQGYADSLEAVRERDRKVDAMADAIRPHAPKLDARYLADEMTTVDRQRGHAEVLLAALVSGLTNVAAFTVDELGHEYTGLAGMETEKVNLHDVGHGKPVGKLTADEVRFAVRRQHMTLVDTIASRLKKAPEGDGTVFDSTMIFYFPDNGETHHSQGTEYPFVVLSGKNAKLDIRGRYIRLPNYGEQGHKTLGNWYTTLLNAYGNPVKHYGDPDPGLARFGIDQTGAIKQFLG